MFGLQYSGKKLHLTDRSARFVESVLDSCLVSAIFKFSVVALIVIILFNDSVNVKFAITVF